MPRHPMIAALPLLLLLSSACRETARVSSPVGDSCVAMSDEFGHESLLPHSCVRMIEDGSYTALLAAAIDTDLGSLLDDSLHALGPNRLVRVASIKHRDGPDYTFAPDVILRTDSVYCFYIGPDGIGPDRWRAMIRNCTGSATAGEGRTIMWEAGPGSGVHVVRTTGAAAYPAAASLDRDSATGGLVVGVRCGAGWCMLGGHGPPTVRALPNPGTTTNRDVRGWHDQQRLAIDSAGVLRPSDVIGTIMAEPGLGLLDERDFGAEPTLVARVHLSAALPQYQVRYNLDVGLNGTQNLNGSRQPAVGPVGALNLSSGAQPEIGPDGAENLISIGQDESGWFAVIVPASGGAPRRFEVNRRTGDHDPPGTARWVWGANGGSIWVRCGAACCEVLPFTT